MATSRRSALTSVAIDARAVIDPDHRHLLSDVVEPIQHPQGRFEEMDVAVVAEDGVAEHRIVEN
jgi:hypothetical protein